MSNIYRWVAMVMGAAISCMLVSCVETPDQSKLDNKENVFKIGEDMENPDAPRENTSTDAKGISMGTEALQEADMRSQTEENMEILGAATGERIVQTIEVGENKILLDAEVYTDGIDRISRYRYIPVQVSDEFREKLFLTLFGDRATRVEKDERNLIWTLKNSSEVGDYYIYQISYSNGGTTIPGEEIFNLEYRYVDLYPFPDNLIQGVTGAAVAMSAEDAVSLCDGVIFPIEDLSGFAMDYIQAYGTQGRRPYYKLVYKKMLDGMPVTGFNDLSFLVDKDGIEKVWGSIFSVEETGLEEPIISVWEATEALRGYAGLLEFDGTQEQKVGRITMEYLVTISMTGETLVVPVWRFWLGGTEEDRYNLRGRILAVDAVTSGLVWEERGNTF